MKLSFCVNPGIGDVLIVRNIFDSIKHLYEEITISPNKNIVRMFREPDNKKLEYYTFCLSFMKYIFNEPPYFVTENSNLPRFSPIENDYKGIKTTNEGLYKMGDFSYLLCNDTCDINEPYVCVTTKIRGTPVFSSYQKYKQEYLKILSDISKKYKIMIIGERVLPKSPENKILGKDRAYCIYDDIIQILPSDRVIDKTLDEYQTTFPDINRIKTDCTYMKNARGVISLGLGGNSVMSLACGTNSTTFIEDVNHISYFGGVVNQPQRKGTVFTNNFKTFIQRCCEL